MPKYYCDYCDTFLTHDSPSVRKTHCAGLRHREAVRQYYQKWLEEEVQKLVDQASEVFKSGKPAGSAPFVPPPGMVAPVRMPPGVIPTRFPSMMMTPPGFPPGMVPPVAVPGAPLTMPGMRPPGAPIVPTRWAPTA